ncbi:hypothetical protein DIPPA_02323 [Diplonema papillatum]|nr:hypothetical protein DIPPA_02323 [Diplonema papillatum]
MQDKSGSGRETAGSKTAPTTAQEEALLRKAFEEAQFEGKPVGVTAPAEEERRKVLLRQKDLDLELILGRTRPLQHCSPPKALRSVDGKDRVEPNPSMLRCELRRRLSADYKGVKESKDDHRDAKDGKDASVLRDMPRDARDAYFVPDAETERLESDGNPAPQITAAPPNGVQRSGSAIDFTHDVIGTQAVA